MVNPYIGEKFVYWQDNLLNWYDNWQDSNIVEMNENKEKDNDFFEVEDDDSDNENNEK